MSPFGWSLLIAVICASLAILTGLERLFDYQQFCNVTCLEATVDGYRVDPWDFLFIRSKICKLKRLTGCRHDFYVTNTSEESAPYLPWEYEICRFRDNKEDIEDCYKICTNFKEQRHTVKRFYTDVDTFHNPRLPILSFAYVEGN